LAHAALHDALTGLPNRVLFMDRLQQVLAHLVRYPQAHGAVLFLDLDRFKHINDSLGHGVGDALLQAFAQRLQGCIRTEDTLARLGGDEFTILLPTITTVQDGVRVAERILDALHDPFTVQGHELFVATSIGIVLVTTPECTVDTVVRDADYALYQAKARGRGGYQLFDGAMHAAAMARFQLEMDVRKAVERQEFTLHYQPIVALRTAQPLGVEVLLRWQHPEHGAVAPATFIPIMEDTGLIIPLGWWVLREACRQLRGWQEQGIVPPTVFISVNVSAKQFTHPDFIHQVRHTVQESGLAASNVHLELTESVLMEPTAAVHATLHAVHALGVQVQLDDFGTGYSSLSYVHQLPLNALKIDRSFVAALAQGDAQQAFVQMIVTLAHTVGLRVIAEGIETAAQWQQVQALGCDDGQGYFFARPLDSVATARWLAAQSCVPVAPPPDATGVAAFQCQAEAAR
jgi:diguanylate cyclase (GGDEF)-like protein